MLRAVVCGWLQIILSPLGCIRLHANSSTGNGRLFPPSLFQHPESLACLFPSFPPFSSLHFHSFPLFLFFPYFLSSPYFLSFFHSIPFLTLPPLALQLFTVCLSPASVCVSRPCLSGCVYKCHEDLGSVWLMVSCSDSVTKSNQAYMSWPQADANLEAPIMTASCWLKKNKNK